MAYVFSPPVIDRVSTSSESVLSVPEKVATENCSDNSGTARQESMFSGCSSCSVASWKDLGVEIKMHSEVHGEFWLVPNYTVEDRLELTPEDFMKHKEVLDTLSGSSIAGFQKNTVSLRRKTNDEVNRDVPF